MRLRGIDIAGGLAVVGVLLLVTLTLWPQAGGTSTTVVQTSGDTVLGPPSATPTPSATATPTPTPSPPEPSPEPSPTATTEPEPAGLTPEQRAGVRIRVVNGGSPDGAAGAATAALVEQSFQPLDPTNAVEPASGTQVLHAADSRLAAETVAPIVGVEPASVTEGRENPNWVTYGSDLDVLVILGSPLP